MMKLSTRSTYGLRAALSLAAQHGQAPSTVAALAELNQIPRRYLEQILNRLRRADLVRANRGPRGGYSLSRSPEQITVGDVVRAVEGELEPVLCIFPEIRSQGGCRGSGCLSCRFCREMAGNLERVLNGTSLADLGAEARRCHPDSECACQPKEILSGSGPAGSTNRYRKRGTIDVGTSGPGTIAKG